jgi:hypothetical protein
MEKMESFNIRPCIHCGKEVLIPPRRSVNVVICDACRNYDQAFFEGSLAGVTAAVDVLLSFAKGRVTENDVRAELFRFAYRKPVFEKDNSTLARLLQFIKLPEQREGERVAE